MVVVLLALVGVHVLKLKLILKVNVEKLMVVFMNVNLVNVVLNMVTVVKNKIIVDISDKVHLVFVGLIKIIKNINKFE